MSVRSAVVLSMSALFCASSFAQSPTGDPERQKAKIVSRTYQMTYGSKERCKNTAKFQTELARSVKEKTVYMRRVTGTPHYPRAREQSARHEKIDPARDTPEKLAGECQYLAELLR